MNELSLIVANNFRDIAFKSVPTDLNKADLYFAMARIVDSQSYGGDMKLSRILALNDAIKILNDVIERNKNE